MKHRVRDTNWSFRWLRSISWFSPPPPKKKRIRFRCAFVVVYKLSPLFLFVQHSGKNPVQVFVASVCCRCSRVIVCKLKETKKTYVSPEADLQKLWSPLSKLLLLQGTPSLCVWILIKRQGFLEDYICALEKEKAHLLWHSLCELRFTGTLPRLLQITCPAECMPSPAEKTTARFNRVMIRLLWQWLIVSTCCCYIQAQDRWGFV